MRCLRRRFERNIILSCILFLSVFILGFVRQTSDFFYPMDIWTLSLLQSFRSPTLDLIMRGFSALGGEDFLILIGASLFWYGKKREGITYMAVLISSQIVNFQTKAFFSLPRPTSHEALIIAHETTAGYPSNHAQNGIYMFSFLAWIERRISLSFPLGICIGISRVYLGVHYPSDVLGGWMFGVAFFLSTTTLIEALEEKRLIRFYDTAGKRVVFAFLFAFIIFFFGAELEFRYKVAPLTLSAFLVLSFLKMDWRVPNRTRLVVALIIGGVGVIALRVGLKMLFPSTIPFDTLRYILLGAWITLVPLLFLKLGIAEKKT